MIQNGVCFASLKLLLLFIDALLMKKIYLTLLFCFSVLLKYGQSDNTAYIKGEILVMLSEDGNIFSTIEKIIQQSEIVSLKYGELISRSMRVHKLTFDSTLNHEIVLKKVKQNNEIILAQFNHKIQQRVNIPNDPSFGTQWSMNNTGQSGGLADADIDAIEAWDISTGGLTANGDTIVVAVIDGGAQLAHPDLKHWKNFNEIPSNNIDDDGNGYIDDVNGWDAISNNNGVSSDQHGTHVNGIIGAIGNNNLGVAGVNWNVQVMVIEGSTQNEAEAVRAYSYAFDNRKLYRTSNGAKGAFIVSTNSSFGVDNGQPSSFPLWCAMYDSLGKEGILSAGATANQNWNIDVTGDIPTACLSPWLVTVTNTTRLDAKNNSAAYGLTTIDLGAPGTSILSTYPNNTYNSLTGTSMATPHVAGAIALMYATACTDFITNYKLYPDSFALIMKNYLLLGTDPISALNNITVTGGRLNLNNALQNVLGYNCSVNDLNEHAQYNDLKLFPNPANNFVELEYFLPEQYIQIEITDVTGRIIQSVNRNLNNGIKRHKLDLESIENGVYFITVKGKSTRTKSMKLIIF
jgi:hypothetical protein